MGRPRPVVEIEVTVLRRGDAAVLVKDGNGNEGWVPHSLIDDESEITENSVPEEEGVLVIPKWKADELGLE
jgi:hypothetical protein